MEEGGGQKQDVHSHDCSLSGDKIAYLVSTISCANLLCFPAPFYHFTPTYSPSPPHPLHTHIVLIIKFRPTLTLSTLAKSAGVERRESLRVGGKGGRGDVERMKHIRMLQVAR